MAVELVETREQVTEGIRQFNEDLKRGGNDLAARLGYNRAWYYDQNLDLVGPSKFIGYAGMTAQLYMDEGALDGKETEPKLRQWFRILERGSPEEALVRSRVEALLSSYGKVLNKAVRFCGPIGWTIAKQKEDSSKKDSPGVRSARGRRTIHATIIKGETQYVAECEHFAIVTQGATLDETLSNLKEAVKLHLEGEDLEALGFAPDPVVVVTMELQPWAA